MYSMRGKVSLLSAHWEKEEKLRFAFNIYDMDRIMIDLYPMTSWTRSNWFWSNPLKGFLFLGSEDGWNSHEGQADGGQDHPASG